MRVFHGPNNIGGAAGVLARAQRDLGIAATSVCYSTGSYEFATDQVVERSLRGRLGLLASAAEFDVFHFYYGESLSGARLVDVAPLRRVGKRVFFYFCGCDLRDSKLVIASGQTSACRECWPMGCSANRTRAVEVADDADGVFVSTPDLLDFMPAATLLPQPVDLVRFSELRAALQPLPSVGGDAVRIAHGPSSRTIKGTRYVEAAVELLQSRGVAVELVLVEGKSHAESLQLYESCDFGIDQLLIGAYGGFSVELMALGKPVICFIRDDVLSRYSVTPPVIRATAETLADTIVELITRREEWPEIGRRGVEYVAAVHDAHVVAGIAVEAYRESRSARLTR